ncbi:MAG: hypothetical protein ACTSU5_02350 [Promethearchaeota archaeon]
MLEKLRLLYAEQGDEDREKYYEDQILKKSQQVVVVVVVVVVCRFSRSNTIPWRPPCSQFPPANSTNGTIQLKWDDAPAGQAYTGQAVTFGVIIGVTGLFFDLFCSGEIVPGVVVWKYSNPDWSFDTTYRPIVARGSVGASLTSTFLLLHRIPAFRGELSIASLMKKRA